MSNIVKIEDQNLTPKELVISLNDGTKKMRKFSSSDWERVSMEIAGLSVLLGVKNVTDMEVKHVVDFLRAEAKDFSYSEFRHALQLNTGGKFGEIIKPFGSILNYVGAVISEYRKYRSKHLAQPKTVIVEPTKEEKEEKALNIREEVFNELNDYYKKGQISFTFLNSVKFYDTLEGLGLIPKYKDVNPKIAKELWDEAEVQLKKNFTGSLDKESRSIVSYLNDKGRGLSDALIKRLYRSRVNIYKGLILTYFLKESNEIIDDLNDLRQ